MSFYARFSASGALAQLTKLEIGFNRIGDAGLTALAEAIKPKADNASGALAPGATVYLGANSATETGKQAMRDAANARGFSVLV